MSLQLKLKAENESLQKKQTFLPLKLIILKLFPSNRKTFPMNFHFSGNNWFNLGGIRAISAVLHGRVGIVSYAYISYI